MAQQPKDSANEPHAALDDLPVDVLGQCLAAVPYKTLREGVTCTCKSWRVLVASEAFKKTREAQGRVGWAVFAGNLDQREMCYLLAPSGTYLTAPRPPDLANDDAHPQGPGMGLSKYARTMRVDFGVSGDKVAAVLPNDGNWEQTGTMRAHMYDPRVNRWSQQMAPLGRNDIPSISLNLSAGIESVGSNIYVLGGDGPRNHGGLEGVERSRQDFDVYDVTTGVWSQRANLPFGFYYQHLVEVDGKLWCAAGRSGNDASPQTFIYDPVANSWTEGPELPQELWAFDGSLNTNGNATTYVAWEGRFCLLAEFEIDLGVFAHRAFAWDPTREEWDSDPFPVPPYWPRSCSSIDDHLVAFVDVAESPWHPAETRKLYVLSPGSTEWAEWRLPDDCKAPGTRVTAVRLGFTL